MKRWLLPLLVCAACLPVVAMTARAPVPMVIKDVGLVLPRPQLLRAIGKSHLQLITDFYWLKTLNRLTRSSTLAESAALLDLGDLITRLDPDFNHAYWAIGLDAPVSPQPPDKIWKNTKGAAELLRRGVERFPADNKLVLALAQNLYSYQRDFVGAAEVLKARAALPDPLPYLAPLATRLLAASGHYDASRDFARAMMESAPDEASRKLFEERLKLIDLEEELAIVDAAAARYHDEHGEYAKEVKDLVVGGYLDHIPIDPFGGVIILKEARSASTATPRLEVYE